MIEKCRIRDNLFSNLKKNKYTKIRIKNKKDR